MIKRRVTLHLVVLTTKPTMLVKAEKLQYGIFRKSPMLKPLKIK